jgi:uncharacterized membrane protein YjfL (UPF0719 family)
MTDILLLSELWETVIKVGVWAAQLIIGIGIAMMSIYTAMRMLNRLTRDIDEEGELVKGNMAVAAMMAGVVIAVALVTSSGVVGLTQAMTDVQGGAGAGEYVRAVIFGLIQLVAGLAFASVSIFLAYRIWDRITSKIDETAELKRGNVAVGVVMGAVMIAVAIVIRQGISGLATAISGIGS